MKGPIDTATPGGSRVLQPSNLASPQEPDLIPSGQAADRYWQPESCLAPAPSFERESSPRAPGLFSDRSRSANEAVTSLQYIAVPNQCLACISVSIAD